MASFPSVSGHRSRVPTPTVVEKDWVGIGSDAGTIPRPVLPNGAEYEGAIVWKRWRQLCLRAGCGRQHWSPVFANEPTTAFGGGLEHMRECPAGTPAGPVCDCARKPACPGRKQLVLGHTSTLTVLDWAQYAAAWHGRTLKWASGTEKCGRSCPPRIVCHAVAVTLHTHTLPVPIVAVYALHVYVARVEQPSGAPDPLPAGVQVPLWRTAWPSKSRRACGAPAHLCSESC